VGELILQNIERHISLSKDDARYILSSFNPKKFNKNESVLQVGECCKYEYFVNVGCLRSFYLDQNEIEHTTMFAISGWWTGNLRSFVTNSPSLFAIEALQDTEVLRISNPQLERLYQKVPTLNKFFRIILQNNLFATQDRVMHHLSSSAETRYTLFNKKFPGLEKIVSQKIIASYLGITPAYLSRLRKKFKSAQN